VSYPCPWCHAESPSFAEARWHVAKCPRLQALGLDLETKVRAGKMTLGAAEAEQARRPVLRL
jgi:hypothetical protein